MPPSRLSLLVPALIILVSFGAMASNQYHTLLMEHHHHFSAALIGHAVMIGAATQIFIPWMVLYASRWVPRPDFILRGVYLGLAFFLILYPMATSPITAMLTYWGSVISLNIAATLQTTLLLAVTRPHGDHWVLVLRSAGTLGYAMSSLLCSTLSERIGYTNLYWIFGSLALFAFLGSIQAGHYIPTESRKIDFRGVFIRLREKNTLTLVLALALANIAVFGATAVISNFIYNEIGGSPRQVGIAWSIATFTEFPLIWLTIPILKRYGLKVTLLTGVVSSTLRMGLIWLCTDIHWLYAIQIFHGLFFGTTLSMVGIFYARQYGPAAVHGLQLVGQSIYGGLASAIGGQLTGMIWSHFGLRSVYLVAFVLLLGALGALVFLFREPTPNTTAPS
jgi:predicted MFS family arabinose efflux permease